MTIGRRRRLGVTISTFNIIYECLNNLDEHVCYKQGFAGIEIFGTEQAAIEFFLLNEAFGGAAQGKRGEELYTRLH